MCQEYEWEYMHHRAEEARKAMQKAEEELRKKPKPAAPAPVPDVKEHESVPA